VERKEGAASAPSGRRFTVLDLPGAYSLDSRTPDEEITRQVLLGQQAQERLPEVLIAVADATHLERNLGIVLELQELGTPVVLALNMMDLAERRGLELDLEVLSRELGVPVVPTVAPRGEGIPKLLSLVEEEARKPSSGRTSPARSPDLSAEAVRARFSRIDRILAAAVRRPIRAAEWTDRLDRIVLHPVWGTLVFAGILTLLFQGIFTWAKVPAEAIQGGLGALGEALGGRLGDGPLRSLLVDGVIAGVGSVLVFLPQILILFSFILALEDSGYLSRAAFLMDRLMGRVGLHGRHSSRSSRPMPARFQESWRRGRSRTDGTGWPRFSWLL
jgi:ferrous iron transport protein B